MKLNFIFMQFFKHQRYCFVFGVFLFALDRLCKHIAFHNSEKTVWFYKNLLGLGYYENTGIALSIAVPRVFILVFTIIFLIIFIAWYLRVKEHSAISMLAMSGIVCGALSNFLDRIVYGYTIDYFIILGSVINVADICIVGGMILLWISMNKNEKRKVHNNADLS